MKLIKLDNLYGCKTQMPGISDAELWWVRICTYHSVKRVVGNQVLMRVYAL